MTDTARQGRGRRLAVLFGALGLLAACSSEPGEDAGPGPASSAAPAGQAASVCAKPPAGPATAPAGAVTVDSAVPGDLTVKTKASPPGTTFWLNPGTHRLGDDRFDQVIPTDGDVFLGAPGAVLDGRKVNQYAFTGHAKNVKIQYLTVRGFAAPRDEGVVNHDSGEGWILEHNLIQANDGAGMMAGAHQQVRANCLRKNGQYGMNAFAEGNTITGLVVEGNEITGNNTGDWERKVDGCGCTGGIKFWSVNGADVRGNWVHDNRGVGLWADTNNNDFLIEGNLIEANDGAAIDYETSYNAVISGNTIRRNNWVEGKAYVDRGDSFPLATIYLSESGGEPRIKARTDKLEISGNVLQDNWSGITLWENADRFCHSPANTSSGSCTRLVTDETQCAQPGIASGPLHEDCRWKTQRVDIHHNRFLLDPAVVGCQETCARMGLLSNFGTYPDWSPYKGSAVQQAITSKQGNRWHDNTYGGPWTFIVYETSRILGIGEWQGPPYQQDAGSTYSRTGGG
ncbi:right-handed parallel beta-helix repeat-containing protein [Amycolatopsis sp. H20-H5]|uniref:right-handed parallel beta-helix repeat-containing protein n=1 Tax=Amycolatopsis sp. H20-H5 TaxID=3046309 RepID=UPI002DB72356|nr:right-handed parallel beta-helix repeat-containing protein [Amycolatopsis sp. H20-H5]MEC3976540.1 right-handed parallel beta-helix repeat-containing protein [Amycolatopsis sp. H20-H5]